MGRRLSPLVFQSALFAILAAIAIALWISRDDVAEALAGLTGQSEQNERAGRRGRAGKLSVVVEPVESAANDIVVEAVGNGRARRSVTLSPETGGEIKELELSAGSRYAKGDILMRLDTVDAELAIDVVNTRLLEARRQAERARQLRANRVASVANVDDAENTLKRMEIELKQAEEALAKRTLRAPFDGVAGIPKVELGDRVTPTTAIATLDDRSELLVEFDIPELYHTRVENGMTITARTPSLADQVFTGSIDQIDSRVDPGNRSVAVRAVLPNKDDLLRPGMSFAVEIRLTGQDYPLIPELALIWLKGQSNVWAVRDGKVDLVPVRIVKRLNSTILVEGQIEKGDLVVIEGVQRLRPGSEVAYELPATTPETLTN